ncbi:MAG: hypothetical protein AAGA48_33075 [Myxococcota bacterium]
MNPSADPSIQFASRVDELPSNAVARAFDDGTAKLFALANAYDIPFSTCFPEGSGFFLDQLERHWRESTEHAWLRLSGAVIKSATAFMSRFVADDQTWADFGDVQPALTVLVVHRERNVLWCASVGAHQAKVFRGKSAVFETPREDWAYAHGQTAGPGLPLTVFRNIEARSENPFPNVVNWRLQQDDELVMLSFPAASLADDDEFRECPVSELLEGSGAPFVCRLRWRAPIA